MRKNKKNYRLNSDSCEVLSSQGLYDSSFHPTNIQHSKSGSESNSLNLHRLESFVNELLLNNEIPFAPYLGNDGKKHYAHSSLARQYFEWMPYFIDVVNRLSPKYDYCEQEKQMLPSGNKSSTLS